MVLRPGRQEKLPLGGWRNNQKGTQKSQVKGWKNAKGLEQEEEKRREMIMVGLVLYLIKIPRSSVEVTTHWKSIRSNLPQNIRFRDVLSRYLFLRSHK